MAAQPPKQRGQAMDELLLDRAVGQVLADDCRFERPVAFGIFQRFDEGFGGQSVAERVPPRGLLAVDRPRSRAFERIAAVRLELVRGCHGSLGPGRGGWGVCGFLPVSLAALPAPPLALVSGRGNAP